MRITYIAQWAGRPRRAPHTRGLIARAIDLLYASIKRSVCLAERYNSLSLERAREKYAADIYGLLVSIFSINDLY